MDYSYIYGNPTRLYLNVTNRCTNRCAFCVRYEADGLAGARLRGEAEPDLAALLSEVDGRGGPAAFSEFIWCGFGEPTFRLDLIVQAASHLRSQGARIRLNTNGHGCLIQRRDILPDLAEAVDEVSVSLNAPNGARYVELCRPDLATSPVAPADLTREPGTKQSHRATGERFWDAMLDFLTRAPAHFAWVQASVVGFTLTSAEIDECRALAASLGVERFRVR